MRLASGVALEVLVTGAHDGVPVLFLHGFTDSWFSFARVLADLPPNVRAIVPSQRGHGASERPQCCYALADFTSDAISLLDGLGVDRAVIVGHSFGSFVAQRLAVSHPERIAALVLVGSAATPRSDVLVEFGDVVQQLADPIDPGFIREFQESTVVAHVPSAFMDGVVAEAVQYGAGGVSRRAAGAVAGPHP